MGVGVACVLYFYESSRRVFTDSAWLHVPDSPRGYSKAHKKGMVINGINNILLRDAVITKLSVGEQTIFQAGKFEVRISVYIRHF